MDCPYGLVARASGSQPEDSGSIPGRGTLFNIEIYIF